MFRKAVLAISIIFSGLSSVRAAQSIDSILNLPLHQLHYFFNFQTSEVSGDLLRQKIKERIVETKREGDLERAAFLFVKDIQMYFGLHPDYTLLDKIKTIDERRVVAEKEGLDEAEALLLIWRGQLLCKNGDWGPGFEQALKGYHLMKDMKADPFFLIDALHTIGIIYLDFGEYHSALRIFMEAAAIKTDEPFYVTPDVFNAIGLCYLRMQQYDSAYHYYVLARDAAAVVRPNLVPVINGNIGFMHFLLGRDEEAAPLLEEDFRLTGKYSGSHAASKLAIIEARRGNREKAAFYEDFVESVWDTMNSFDAARYHDFKYELSHSLGEYKEASHHAMLARKYKNLVARDKDAQAIKEANLKVNVELHAAEVRLLEEQRQRQVLLRNGLLIMLLLIGFSGFLMIKRIQERHQKKLELAAIQAEADAQRIRRAEMELNQFTKTLVEKNELIENFHQQISELHDLTSTQQDAREVRVADMMQLTILTDQDWQYFRQLFDEVHPGFSTKLHEKYPDLTPAETRLLTLTKLKLPTRHMANMLGISPDSVKKTRHRLRKKINLPEEGNLEDVIKDV